MSTPSLALVGALAAAAFLCALPGLAADRDWAKNPAVMQVEAAGEIFAVGDAHGDYVRFARALNAAGLIDSVPDKPEDARWRAGRAVLVVTGDMIDKGPRALDVIRLLLTLQASSAREGGLVIVLAGNHEAEFLADPSAAKVKEFADQLAAAGLNPREVAACKEEIGAFLCALPFAARVNDWFFAHGGNTAGKTLSQIETGLESAFAKSGFAAKELIGDYSILEARLNGSGPGREPWIEAGLPDRDERKLLGDYAAALGVHHIVEGHVPTEVGFADGTVRKSGEMFQRFGLLFLIDTGMSQGVDESHGAVLHIASGTATTVCPDGKTTLLWDAKDRQDAGRAAPCGK